MDIPEDPEFINVREPIPPGRTGIVVCTEQAPGAMLNGTIVEKTGSKPGDAHPDGSRAKVMGSIGPGKHPENGSAIYGYWVVWDDIPTPCFVAGERIRPVSL